MSSIVEMKHFQKLLESHFHLQCIPVPHLWNWIGHSTGGREEGGRERGGGRRESRWGGEGRGKRQGRVKSYRMNAFGTEGSGVICEVS